MLEIRNLSVRYGAHPALNEVSLKVEFGEIVVILGANGAGKSSLLKAAVGMSEGQVTGSVMLDGAVLSGTAPDKIVEMGVAFVPEGRGIFGDLTVGENLTLGAYSSHARKSQRQNLNRVYDLFPKLRERNDQTARTMSGGEQQMVAIGRAMMSDPKILMLDEPSLGLSPLLCKELFANLTKVRETGIGVLMVEQNAKQSLAIADRGYLIENGSITGENDAAAMLSDPAVQAAYLGGAAASAASGVSAANVASAASAATSLVENGAMQGDGSRPGTKSFMSPGEFSNSDLAPVSSDAISSMVAKASQASHQTTPHREVEPRKTSSAGAPRVVPTQTIAPASSDPELQALVQSMEDSARRARSGVPLASPGRPPSAPEEKTQEQEILPTIPVYKKSTVEVYRRVSDGSMQRVKR